MTTADASPLAASYWAGVTVVKARPDEPVTDRQAEVRNSSPPLVTSRTAGRLVAFVVGEPGSVVWAGHANVSQCENQEHDRGLT